MRIKKLDEEDRLFVFAMVYSTLMTIGLPLALCWGVYKIVELVVNSFK